MIDFLRANPWCSREDYMWGMSVAQVRLASFDYSRVEYLDKDKKDKQKKTKSLQNAQVINGAGDLSKNLTDFGIPIINKNK